MIPQPTYLLGLSACTNTARIARITMSTPNGSTYQEKNLPSSGVTPRNSCTNTAASTDTSTVANSTKATASVLGTM